MSEIEGQSLKPGHHNRRTIVKGAAWSVPVIAAAIAAPAASASIAAGSMAWYGLDATLLQLHLLNGGLAQAKILPSAPRGFRVINGSAGAINGPITGTLTVEHTGGLIISVVGRPKGFRPYSIGPLANGQFSVTESNKGGGLLLGRSVRSVTTFTLPGSVASNSEIVVPVEWALTQSGGSLVDLNVLVTYTATLTLTAEGKTLGTNTASIKIPVGADIIG